MAFMYFWRLRLKLPVHVSFKAFGHISPNDVLHRSNSQNYRSCAETHRLIHSVKIDQAV